MKFKLKNLAGVIIIILSVIMSFSILISSNSIRTVKFKDESDLTDLPILSDYNQFSQGNFSGYEFSNYNLSVFLDEDTSTVAGNLTIDYYNDDPLNFTQIPFHIYASGMQFDKRPGYIEILNVTTLGDPKEELDYDVYSNIQLMWINLTDTLEPGNRTSFIISFNTTLPDGGIDRANEYGWDYNETRIFKFASCYPQPCVYDEFDSWNIDPYLLIGDPFYFDMAYYDLIINVPENMTVAATGELIENKTIGERTIHHYNPHLPVREITFSTSRYFVVESYIVPEVNITVSSYFLPKSYWLWHDFALAVGINSGVLYHNTFGNYCYSTFNIVQEYTHYGGMEYPLQIYATESADSYTGVYGPYWYLETIIAHEVAHQWFYNLLGVDEVDWGFLDEGIVCWVTDWYKDVFHPDWYIFEPYWGLERVRHYSLNYDLPNKINQSVPDCLISGTDYWYLGYTKTNTILEKLRSTIGHEKFIEGLTLFFQDYYFEIADLADLQNTFETVVGDSLDWFFFPWFDNPYLPKYNITNVIYDAKSKIINVTIEDINKNLNQYNYSQQVPINIYGAGSSLIFSDSEWINSTSNLLIPLESTPQRVVINYSDFVLVQFSDYGLDYLETTDITIINQQQKIPGYNILIIILSFGALGLIILYKKSKFLIKK